MKKKIFAVLSVFLIAFTGISGCLVKPEVQRTFETLPIIGSIDDWFFINVPVKMTIKVSEDREDVGRQDKVIRTYYASIEPLNAEERYGDIAPDPFLINNSTAENESLISDLQIAQGIPFGNNDTNNSKYNLSTGINLFKSVKIKSDYKEIWGRPREIWFNDGDIPRAFVRSSERVIHFFTNKWLGMSPILGQLVLKVRYTAYFGKDESLGSMDVTFPVLFYAPPLVDGPTGTFEETKIFKIFVPLKYTKTHIKVVNVAGSFIKDTGFYYTEVNYDFAGKVLVSAGVGASLGAGVGAMTGNPLGIAVGAFVGAIGGAVVGFLWGWSEQQEPVYTDFEVPNLWIFLQRFSDKNENALTFNYGINDKEWGYKIRQISDELQGGGGDGGGVPQ